MPDIRKTGSTSNISGIYDFARTARTPVAEVEAPNELDQAGITEGAREMSRALTVVRSAGEVRAERIAALRAQIASGDYEPDPRAIAREILERGL